MSRFKGTTNRTLADLRATAQKESQREIQEMESKATDITIVDKPVVESKVKPSVLTLVGNDKKKTRKFEMPSIKTKAEKKLEKKTSKKPRVVSEEDLKKKYPHIVLGTLKQDNEHNKRSVEAKLACGHTMRVFTSDLFQIKVCSDCKKKKTTEVMKTKFNDKSKGKVVAKAKPTKK